MRFTPGIMTSLLKAIDRRGFKAIVARHSGDACDKEFDSRFPGQSCVRTGREGLRLPRRAR